MDEENVWQTHAYMFDMIAYINDYKMFIMHAIIRLIQGFYGYV